MRTRADPAYDDSALARGRRAARLEHRARPDDRPAGTSAGTGFLQGGLGWYRKTFTLPAVGGRQADLVEFDGVYMDSIVYFNGQQVGSHPYGYTGFAVDLTSVAHTDGATDNVLAVKVQQPAAEQPLVLGQRHLPPRAPRGHRPGPRRAPRHVRDHARPRGHDRRGLRATCTSDTTVVNEGGERVARQQPGARPARQGRGRRRTDTGRPARATTRGCGRSRTRYLYTLTTAAERPRQGRRLACRTRFGIRWFRIDPNEGFFLNGAYHKIQGVDLHHDLGALGAAVNRDAIDAPDADHEEHGRQRLAHVAQPALAGDDRGLRGARHRDDGRGVRHLAHAEAAVRLRALLRRQQRRGHQGDGPRRARTRRP